jgi:transcriptional regulator with XRE-family HTH domain
MKPNVIDPYVGTRIRDYRKKLGWTLAELGEKLDISPQQMQKYEQGRTRISVDILYRLSSIMVVRSDYFFEGFTKPKLNMSINCDMEDAIPEERKRPIDVLLVENDPEEALVTRKAIEKSNVAVNFHLLHTGKQALTFLKKGQSSPTFPRPEIIILELSIPKGEGYVTLREIKRDRSLCDIPVIVLANSVKDVRCLGSNEGCGKVRVDHCRSWIAR